MKVKTILVDDEPLAVAELQNMLKLHEEIDVVTVSHEATDAIEKINRLQPQLVFLDINLPGKNGFDLLGDLEEAPEVIFVTAYDQFAIKAFDVNALDYILKPVNPDRLAEAITKIGKKFTEAQSSSEKLTIQKRIFIKDGEQCFFVPLSEIYFIESVGNYARVYYQDKKPLLHKSLNYLDEKLPEEFFFRASRQQMFNISFVKSIIPYFSNTLQVELQGGIKVDLSQRQSVKFKEKMGI
jgi:two-component system, LytTR family, response regulator